ncbi:hypothetical protein ABTY53_04540 [Streptomyces noursei]
MNVTMTGGCVKGYAADAPHDTARRHGAPLGHETAATARRDC